MPRVGVDTDTCQDTFYQKCRSVIQSVNVGFCTVVFELNVNFSVMFLLGFKIVL